MPDTHTLLQTRSRRRTRYCFQGIRSVHAIMLETTRRVQTRTCGQPWRLGIGRLLLFRIYLWQWATSWLVWSPFVLLTYWISMRGLDQTEIAVSSFLHRPLPPTNLFFMSISRIHEVKHGPFHEHSSQLHSIAVGVPNWGKVNSGLFKMYEVGKSRHHQS